MSEDPRQDSRQLRILTYNVGLLRVKLLGVFEVWGNPPYSTERLPLIPDKLKSVDADIITLQGSYLLLLPSLEPILIPRIQPITWFRFLSDLLRML